MRADRLISILLLLQIHRRLTSHELAERLEVSERTIHRDMEALSIAGIPVMAERGTGGGWSLIEGYRSNLTGLSEAEVQALFLSRPAGLLADLGLDKASEAGLIKLQASLPLPHQRDATFAQERIHVDLTGWNNAKEAVPLLPMLFEAVWNERRLQITYNRGDCDPVERLVDPLGLVAKGSAWYLVANVEGSLRSYRISRIQSASILPERCQRPATFDLVAYWKQSAVEFKEKFPRYAVTLRVHPDFVSHLYLIGRFSRVEKVEEPAADGWRKAVIVFQVEEMAVEGLLGLGANIEILEPVELREQIIEQAKNIIAFYEYE
ncbi:MAG: YafY family transcriptional regulator [Acidobacteria bacterium]|nr:YafY family transcriptional regulator [Acidobacteriota bacterium]